MDLNPVDFVKRLLPTGAAKPRRPVEITAQDQWVLKVLLRARDRFVTQETIVEDATMERPTLIPHELVAALFKLQMYGWVETDGEGAYRVTKRGRKLRDIIPERPGVNIDYYG